MAAAAAADFGLKDSGLVHTNGYINGKWLDTKESSGGATFDVTNPATDDALGAVADMDITQTKEAIGAASAALKTWSQTTARHRHDLLMKLYKLILENIDDLARIVTLENGKLFSEAKGEIIVIMYPTDPSHRSSTYPKQWFAEEAIRSYGEVIPSSVANLRCVVVKQPIGVCGIITPWNFPSAMITRQLAPALAAGCTVVIKPAPETPFSALAIAELVARAGFPTGVTNVVTTSTHTEAVGKELLYTLYGQSASTLKKVTIEAGGNAAFIVFDDADLDEAVSGLVTSKFCTSGQACISANRVYVQSGVYARFASLFAEKVKTLKAGNGFDADAALGPLIHARAAQKVESYVKDAVEHGATVLVGGKRLQGNFFEPTVLVDVPGSARLSKEEIFGPLAALIKFDTEEEVIQLANDTAYGLAGYIYSRDVGRVWRVAEALEVGVVGANMSETLLVAHASCPFGGVKESGLGREGSRHGLDEYLNMKYVAFGGL